MNPSLNLQKDEQENDTTVNSVTAPEATHVHWKNSQISKFDQTWISTGFPNIRVNKIPKLGFKLDKSWIFQTKVNKPVKPKLVFKKITIKPVYHKT